MLAFLFEHKLLVIPGAYIVAGIFVVWFLDEIRRIDDEKASLVYRGFSDKRFAVYKCFVVIAAVVLWPFVLRRRWNKRGQSKPKEERSLAGKQGQAVEPSSVDWR